MQESEYVKFEDLKEACEILMRGLDRCSMSILAIDTRLSVLELFMTKHMEKEDAKSE